MTAKNDGEGPSIGSVSENNITQLPVEVKKKYSYTGIGAKTHDVKTLEQAVRLDDIGKATPEEIRKQTGWFKGYDGKWRFELDERIKKITEASVTMASESPQRSAETSVTDNISQVNSDVKEKYSRQLNNTADNIEQLKAENESFSEYVDEVVQELQSKLKNKKQPDVVKIFDRKELYKIAAKYNIKDTAIKCCCAPHVYSRILDVI